MSKHTQIKQFLDNLVGGKIVRIKIKDIWYNPLELLIKPNDQLPQRAAILGIESFWRLETTNDYICGCGDNLPFMHEKIQALSGKILKSYEVLDPVFETSIYFSDDYILRFMPVCVDDTSHLMFGFGSQLLQLGPDGKYVIKPHPSRDASDQ